MNKKVLEKFFKEKSYSIVFIIAVFIGLIGALLQINKANIYDLYLFLVVFLSYWLAYTLIAIILLFVVIGNKQFERLQKRIKKD